MQKIRRTSVTSQAVAAIRAHITSGNLAVGDKLATEAELSASLGVGRSTVREAIRTLEAMGYVELRPGRGAFVRVTSDSDASSLGSSARAWFTESAHTLAEFGRLRQILEPAAAAMAAEAHTEEGIIALEAAMSAFAEAICRRDAAALAEADRQFHTTLMHESGNSLLYELYGHTAELFTAYSVRSFTAQTENAPRTMEEHRRVLRAVIAGDAAAAEEAMRAHLTSAEAMIDSLRE